MSLTIRVKNPFRQTSVVALATIALFAAVALLTRSPARHDNNASGQFTNGAWQVYFSPRGGCTDAIVHQLEQAKDSVFVHAYSFTSEPIAKALVNANKRGVKVSVILDKSQRTENYSEADFLSHSGIPVLIDDRHAIDHNKVIVIDGRTVVTGSFNFTKAAEERNAENLLVIQDQALAQRYSDNWNEHAAHSQPYTAK